MALFNNLTNDSQPVKNAQSGEQKLSYCGTFTGELSSKTGISSKYLFIAKIDEISGASSWPEVRIACGPECNNGCINMFKNYIK